MPSNHLPEFLEEVKKIARPGERGLAIIQIGADVTDTKKQNPQDSVLFETKEVLGRINDYSNITPRKVDDGLLTFTSLTASFFENCYALDGTHSTLSIEDASKSAAVLYIPTESSDPDIHSNSQKMKVMRANSIDDIDNDMVDVYHYFLPRVFMKTGVDEMRPKLKIDSGKNTLREVEMDVTLYVGMGVMQYVKERKSYEATEPILNALNASKREKTDTKVDRTKEDSGAKMKVV